MIWNKEKFNFAFSFIVFVLVAPTFLTSSCKDTGNATDVEPLDGEPSGEAPIDLFPEADVTIDEFDLFETPPDKEEPIEDQIEEEPASTSPFEGYCKACTYEEDCPEGGVCVKLNEAELSCSIPCNSAEDCPEGAVCSEVSESDRKQCIPYDSTCIYTRIGSPCPSWGCSGRYNLCSSPEGGIDGYCTRWCESDVDCEEGFTNCIDRGDGVKVCMKSPLSPQERCGNTYHSSGIGSPCMDDGRCPEEELLCATEINPNLPQICLKPCSAPEECEEEGAKCAPLQGTEGTESFCIPDECSCLAVAPGSLLDEILSEANITRCDLHWEVELLEDILPLSLVHDRFRIKWTDDVHNDFLRMIPFATSLESRIDSAFATGVYSLICEAASLSGHPIECGGTLYEPNEDEPLVDAISRLVDFCGAPPDVVAYREDAEDIPEDIQRFAASIILAIIDAISARQDAIAVVGGDSWKLRGFYNRTSSLFLPSPNPPIDVTDRKVQDFLIGDFKYELIYQSAYNIAYTVESKLGELLPHGVAERFSFNQQTPVGRVVISDASDNSYTGAMTEDSYLLVIDVGGNDHYEISSGANSNIDNPVSVLIDLGGDDFYGYEPHPDPNDGDRLPSDGFPRATPTADYGPFSLSMTSRQGGARMGVAMLFDLGGSSDTYTSLRLSQGSAVLGAGILYDDGGSDTYQCESACQASSAFGMGLLIDGGDGVDNFSSYHESQGFAYVQGVSILYSEGGSDTYYCNKDDVLYPSAQDRSSNASLCQGMGFGRRSDISLGGDGVYMSGGIGILRDLSGNDTYEAAIFAQGSGYWFGFGFLFDGDGSDHYNARWYVQGAAAHFASALLHDAGGNDIYNLEEERRLNVSLGAGHDFSNGFLLETSGSDIYYSPNLSIGCGNDNGFGFFVDTSSNDEYHSSSNFSFGNANITEGIGRGAIPSIGIFLDCEATDSYDRPDTTILGNDRTWRQKRHPELEMNEIGMGGDSSTLPCGIL